MMGLEQKAAKMPAKMLGDASKWARPSSALHYQTRSILWGQFKKENVCLRALRDGRSNPENAPTQDDPAERSARKK